MTKDDVPFLTIANPLRVFLDHSPATAWIKDSEGRHVYLNPSYCEQIGVPATDWQGKTDYDLWPAELADKFLEADRQVLETGEPLRFEDEENYTLPHGEARTWWVVKFPITDRNGVRYVGGIAIDINEQKVAERERQALEQEITNIVSREQSRIGQELHDVVGQELTALNLFASSLISQLSLAAAADPDQNISPQILALASRLAKGLQETNEHLRAVSRGLLPVEVDGAGLASAVTELVHRTDQHDHVNCVLSRCDLHHFSDTDTPAHLFRVVQEAVHNAVKHAEASRIDVSLAEVGDLYRLRVCDNGRGFQTRDERRQGMGLRIMKYRAELIGARWSMQTAVGKGTRITCEISSEDES